MKNLFITLLIFGLLAVIVFMLTILHKTPILNPESNQNATTTIDEYQPQPPAPLEFNYKNNNTFKCGGFNFFMNVPASDMQYSVINGVAGYPGADLYAWTSDYESELYGSVAIECFALRDFKSFEKFLETNGDSVNESSEPLSFSDFEKNYDVVSSYEDTKTIMTTIIARHKSIAPDQNKQYIFIFVQGYANPQKDRFNMVRLSFFSPKYDIFTKAAFDRLWNSFEVVQ